jgi:predicted alpha/beta-hydrolase family hydrolase
MLRTGPDGAPLLLFAHGAGASMESDWMTAACAALARHGVATLRFEFDYMAARRSGGRKPPPRAEKLLDEYLAALDAASGDAPRFIGGKSMGGRVASLVATDLHKAGRINGLVVLSYPFHPPAKPEATRTAHLADLAVPTLICQGTRDPFGSRDEVETYTLSPAIQLAWTEDGDHDLAPRRSVTGQNLDGALEVVAATVAGFVRG